METLFSALRHVAKDLFKVGIIAYDTAADALAHTSEGLKDLAAEARAELKVGGVNQTMSAETPEVRDNGKPSPQSVYEESRR